MKVSFICMLGGGSKSSFLLKGRALDRQVMKHLFQHFLKAEWKVPWLLGSLISSNALSHLLPRGWTHSFTEILWSCMLLPDHINVLLHHHSRGVQQVAGHMYALAVSHCRCLPCHNTGVEAVFYSDVSLAHTTYLHAYFFHNLKYSLPGWRICGVLGQNNSTVSGAGIIYLAHSWLFGCVGKLASHEQFDKKVDRNRWTEVVLPIWKG